MKRQNKTIKKIMIASLMTLMGATLCGNMTSFAATGSVDSNHPKVYDNGQSFTTNYSNGKWDTNYTWYPYEKSVNTGVVVPKEDIQKHGNTTC